MRRLLSVCLLSAIMLGLPASTGTDCHQAFNSIQDQFRFWHIQMYHGHCAVATDFSHIVRAGNGERCRLR